MFIFVYYKQIVFYGSKDIHVFKKTKTFVFHAVYVKKIKSNPINKKKKYGVRQECKEIKLCKETLTLEKLEYFTVHFFNCL